MAKRKAPKDDAQVDVFAPLFSDIASRDAHETMEMPFFSLSKNPRFKAIRYKNEARGIEVIVTGGEPIGIATIWDKDILIWAVSQIREAIDRGETPSRTIYFHPYQLLKAVRRGTRGQDYERLERAMARLSNTAIFTTVRQQHFTTKRGFHWLEGYGTAKDNKTGETAGMWSITLANWMYQAAAQQTLVLTLDDDYFLLTGGLERWLYLIARKHGGRQESGFTMPMRTLYKKCSTTREYRYFARDIRKIAQANDLPGYVLEISTGKDDQEYITFLRRSQLSFRSEDYEMDVPRNLRKRLLGD
jgi:plasmid replication initiation protein